MADAPLTIILEMISLLIQHTINTFKGIFSLLLELFGSLSAVSTAGTLGLLVAYGVLALVGFFLAKFFFGSVKKVLVLLSVGFLVLMLIIFGTSL
jgi:hypothetical protein